MFRPFEEELRPKKEERHRESAAETDFDDLKFSKAECDTLAKFVEKVAIRIAPIPTDSFEKVGREFLEESYGAAGYSADVARYAGAALAAYQSDNIVEATANVEQVYVAMKKMYPKQPDRYLKDPNADPEVLLKDPARRAAGDAARENVAWAAGGLGVAAGTDEAKKVGEESGKAPN